MTDENAELFADIEKMLAQDKQQRQVEIDQQKIQATKRGSRRRAKDRFTHIDGSPWGSTPDDKSTELPRDETTGMLKKDNQ